ncbi:hypothetical protein P4679_22430 [Priestia megaterium]|uniref:hypothetical protein n=1 Tax=Priestia megaterium TaxID=1404 RepID=UPI002E229B7A|nr:hypothetical protein [Priestia megaterium]
MRFGNHRKLQRIHKTEEVIKKVTDGIKMFCSNDECNNIVTLDLESSARTIMCSKCHSGFFIKKKQIKKKPVKTTAWKDQKEIIRRTIKEC